MTNEELIAAFYAKGGKAIRCPDAFPKRRREGTRVRQTVEETERQFPGTKGDPCAARVYVNSHWIARAETWLRENGFLFRTASWATRGKGYAVSFPRRHDAMLFTLWWTHAKRWA